MQRIPSQPVMAYLWAAGFSFTISQVMMELVPYDPNLEHLFFGEEISMALRFFSHGGIFFTPPQSVVYHLWSRDHRPVPRSDTDEVKEIKKNKRIKSQQIVLDMLKGIKNETVAAQYQLGRIQSINEYEQYLNVSFHEMKLISNCLPYDESIFASNPFDISDTTPQNPEISKVHKNIEVLNIVQSFLK